jgi:D-glycero-alpha-D-manno-heptose-7-phosphate kinase
MIDALRMAYVQTPFRISFFGGGTDFPDFFNKYRGAVVGMTINRYSYVALNLLERIKDNILKLTYSKLELVKRLDDVNHSIVRCVLEAHPEFVGNKFIDIHSFADLPSKTGIGSSSAFTVGLLQAFYSLYGLYRAPDQLAYEAIDIERNKLNAAGGWQDQIMCAYGGFNSIDFCNNTFSVNPIILKSSTLSCLENSLLFFYTQEQRTSCSIQQKIFSKTNIDDKRGCLGDILATTDECLKIIHSQHHDEYVVGEFGKLLHETWQLKRSLGSGVSSSYIDKMYAAALNAGAYGGKVCGAGGGGFMFFSVPPDAQDTVRKSMAELQAVEIPVRFSRNPSRILFAAGA